MWLIYKREEEIKKERKERKAYKERKERIKTKKKRDRKNNINWWLPRVTTSAFRILF